MDGFIKIKKGLDIKLLGEAQNKVTEILTDDFALKPTDFIGVFPRLLVKEGDIVKAGSPVFCDKYRESVQFTSPVSGKISEIRRGDKRVLLEVGIQADKDIVFEDFGREDMASLGRRQLIDKMLLSGVWPAIRQRPYTVIANPDDTPAAIFISGFDSAPLSPDYAFILKDELAGFQAGVDVLARLTSGKVYIGIPEFNHPLAGIRNAVITCFKGPHPAGNVGIQIHHIRPINKGDIVWTVNPQDVVVIGRLFSSGRYDASVTVALAGSEVREPQYYKVRKGISVKPLISGNLKGDTQRIISGNVLTGDRISHNGYLGFYHNQFTVIPEGNYFEFMGWAMPGFGKFSFSKTFFSWAHKDKKYKLDTNFHGGERSYVMTGQYEKVLPMDILPMQLIKACLLEDVELMEKLGIYEVDEEDFALVEYIDTSKTEIQSIIRKGIDLIRKEMS
ncbi:MAG TPA: Na(+)-translocating NADH-quinone reductase subunit A [Bacteroidales bacterium]|nr:Na(+)-translocating NADH-quinone reductase subunit A [Bacteroidales bacterium]HPT02479.1 Na(+)-translocating NADH-quinone reductase subunit A [Bacteroidales bacterium]